MNKPTLILYTFLLLFLNVESQEYLEMMNSEGFTVQETQNAAKQYFEIRGKGRGTGYKTFKRWEYNAIRMQDENGFLKSSSFYINELERYNSEINNATPSNQTSLVSNWEQLGPTTWNQTSGWNPGVGRITSIAIDTKDANHIIVGSPGGGVWKTTDGGTNWSALTDNLSNVLVYALTIDPVNSDIYYWGSNFGLIFKSTDAGATWNQLADVGNGTVNKILINPSDTNIMFCSADYSGGGVFKSTDGGVNWSLIHTESTRGYDVEFKPGDYSVVYASGNKFFKSTNSGQSFVRITGDDALTLWSQEYVTGTVDWVLSSTNSNNGVTPKSGTKMAFFQLFGYVTPAPISKLITPAINLSGSSSPVLKFSYTNKSWIPNIIGGFKVFYKIGMNGTWNELANYTAEATTWQDITINLPNPSADYYIAFEAESESVSGVTLDDISVENSTGVVYSDDFEFLPSINNFNLDAKMIGVTAVNPEVVYLLESSGGAFGGFHKSTDGGDNFTKLDHTGKNYFGYSSTADDTRGQAPRDMDIVVNPNDANDVHIAGILSWRSTDGGVNFNVTSQWIPQVATNENIGYCHADIDIMVYQNNKLYVGSDGGIFVANDPLNVSSFYFTDLSSGLGIRQFYNIGVSQTNPVIVTGGSQDNGSSVYRADGTWVDWLGADGMESFVDHSDSNILYGTSQFGSLYKSIDQGNSRTDLMSPDGKSGNWITPFEQDPSGSNTIYSGYDQIYKSTDGGQSWNSISQSFSSNADQLKIAPSDANIMYAAYDFAANIYKTTNGGVSGNWTQLTGFSGAINSIAIHPTNPNKVAVATTSSTNKVYVTEDGGATWTSWHYDLPSFAALAVVWDTTYNEDILYIGMNYGIYYLRQNTTSWTPYSTGLPNVKVNELEINFVDKKLYAGTYGRGLWRVDLYNPSSAGLDEFEVSDLEVSPNPSTGLFKLDWKLNKRVTIKIYDPLGKLVFYEKNRDL